ncbi:hypothetical protein BP5796_01670 [Coleophoma crateriformis]|uniref:Uncharacterized protein n=1 Tax=Coleophoma crateriformis TaxID=565419 RepID=A0A3D8T138_9HELO|nr:hypothetical protein BP5796_01670 [Coleophoma crateriformis]
MAAVTLCSWATVRQDHTAYEIYSGEQLKIEQIVRKSGGSGGFLASKSVQTFGQVNVRRLPDDEPEKSKGYITFDIWVSDERIDYEIEMDRQTQSLRVVTPTILEVRGLGRVYLSIEVNVWLPINTTFQLLDISTDQFKILVQDDVHVDIAHTKLSAISASIDFAHSRTAFSESDEKSISANPTSSTFKSLDTEITTNSGSIKGLLNLYNSVKITSSSGAVSVAVIPQDQSQVTSQSAQLSIKTKSGSIRGQLPIYNRSAIPSRDYQTTIESSSGSVKGSYILGSLGVFNNGSGGLQTSILPVLQSRAEGKSGLTTNGASGSSHVNILAPLHYSGHAGNEKGSGTSVGGAIRTLSSKHSSNSGSMKVFYPVEWEGVIRYSGGSGGLRVGGEGVDIQPHDKESSSRQRIAFKGENPEEGSEMVVNGKSGAVEVRIRSQRGE